MDRKAAARAIEDFLRALGHEPIGELAGTGERVAEAWQGELLHGYSVDPAAVLRAGSIELHSEESASNALIVLRDLAVMTMCPHHLLPAYGRCMVAYLPGRSVAGLGTIAQVVDAFARRLSLQEQIGAQVADLLVKELKAKGALCKLSLTHMCLALRGEKKEGAIVETLSFAGSFAVPHSDRDLALACVFGAGAGTR